MSLYFFYILYDIIKEMKRVASGIGRGKNTSIP
jgi:hypothetical protein